MTAQLLEGKPVADAVLEDVRRRVAALAAKGVVPGLGTILAGDDPASAGYVRKKHETCAQVGIASFNQEIPSSAGQAGLLQAVDRFNADPAVDGYLIQPPVLPTGLDEFVELVIPELQNRGLFRTEYEGETLRENLGLRRPKSRYSRPV